MSSALKHPTSSDNKPASSGAKPTAPATATTKVPDMGRRRSSVQFSADTKDNKGATPSKETSGAFRQNMNDFLSVMYGKDGKALGTSSKPPMSHRHTDNPIGSRNPSKRSDTAKGPLVKGRTAHDGADNIDALVDTLVKAYSKKSASNINQGNHGVGDTPISYNRAPRTVSPRYGAKTDVNEVSTFVSQAMGGMLDTNPLTSKRSILSSLGLDDNFANKLLSFHTHSNLQDASDSEGSLLEPKAIGEQAMFKSIGAEPRDVSVSKSMDMRGRIPPLPPSEKEETMTKLTAPANKKRALAPANDMSLNSAQLTGAGAGRRGIEKSMKSLDSKALGIKDVDDSWADVDAEQARLASGGASPAVGGVRSLMNYSKEKIEAIQKLVEEEKLNRDVKIAVEKELRGYIDTEFKRTMGKGGSAKAPASTGKAPPGKVPPGKGPMVGKSVTTVKK